MWRKTVVLTVISALVLQSSLYAKSSQALIAEGVAHYKAGRYQAAEDVFTRAIAQDTGQIDAYRYRAYARMALNDVQYAISDYDKILFLAPNDAQAYNDRGIARRRLNDLRGAIVDYDKAISLSPKNASFHNNRGFALQTMGDHQGAIKSYERALVLDPQNAKAKANLKAVREQLVSAGGRLQPLDVKSTSGAVDKAGSNVLQTPASAPVPASAAASATANQSSATDDIDERGVQQPPEPTEVTIPAVKFKADDPCDALNASQPSVPWQKIAASAKEPAVIDGVVLPAAMDYAGLSNAQYAGAVSMAKEGMRLLYGPLSVEDNRRFEKMWAPLYDYPSQAIVGYLNALNPLLVQFLAGREALMRAAAAYQGALLDVSLAVSAGERVAWEEAMAVASHQAQTMRLLQGGLTQLAQKIEALGNPPSPIEEKCGARKRHRDAVQALGQKEIGGGDFVGEWQGTLVCPEMPAAKQDDFFPYPTETAGVPSRWEGVCGWSHIVVFKASNYNFGTRHYDQGLGMMALSVSMMDNMRIEGMPSYMSNPTYVFFGGFPEGLDVLDARDLNSTSGHRTQISGMPALKDDRFEVSFKTGDGKPRTWKYSRVSGSWDGGPKGYGTADLAYLKGLIEQLTEKNKDMNSMYLGIEALENILKWRIKIHTWREAFHDAAKEFLKDYQAPMDAEKARDQVERRTEKLAGSYPPPDLSREKPFATPEPVAAAEQGPKEKTAIEESVAFHQSMIGILEKNLERERIDLSRAIDDDRRKELMFRILGIQSDIQAEKDLIASYKTGQIVHTRSVFDQYVHEKFIRACHFEAAKVDYTRRIARGIERQIALLPQDQQAAMRATANRILDPKTMASGDYERARKLAEAMNNQVQGHWQGEAAKHEERAIANQEYEFYMQMPVMAAGAVVVGIGTGALMATFGETAAITVMGPHLIGGIYGGVTGYIMGGPNEGIKQSIAWSSTVGYMATQFVEGWDAAAADPKSSTRDRAYQAMMQMGGAFIGGQVFKFGTTVIAKGTAAMLGPNSRLLRPIAPMFRPTVQQQFDAARMRQQLGDAQSLITHYQGKEFELARLRGSMPQSSPQIQAAERELNRLAASLNSSYHCKWLLKYQAHPLVRGKFSARVDQSYNEMMPELYADLRRQGYYTKGLEFRPMRNASSAGTSSMDLDLALRERPNMVIIKNGKPVSLEQFQKDAQRALNRAYHKTTGFSATRSDLLLTTSRHDEAFTDPRLLRGNVDFDAVAPQDIANIGRVIGVKTSKIRDDKLLSEIGKVQAGCRESYKELDNMLIPGLTKRLKNATPGTPEHASLKNALEHWERVKKVFDQIGRREADPYQILALERELRTLTGGRGVHQTISDLGQSFRQYAR